MTINAYPRPQTDRKLTLFAWTIIALTSALPDIFWAELAGVVPIWLPYAKMGFLTGLVLTAIIWKPLRPLRNFFVIMVAFFGLQILRPYINFTIPALQNLFGANVFDLRMQAEQTGKLAITLVMLGLLLVLGYKKRDFFLAKGDLRAPIQPVKILGFPKSEPWPKFGLIWAFGIAAALGVVLFLGMHPTENQFLQLLPVLPSIIFYAALNAFNEEMFYRAPILTCLEPVGGSIHSLWMAAYFFGISHYFGVPSGIPGALASIFMGWILSKAMLETRGLFWSWLIHIMSDIVIFSFLVMNMVH